MKSRSPVGQANDGWLRLPAGGAHLKELVTAESHRGLGIAPGAISAIAGMLAADKIEWFIGRPEAGNVPSRRVYEKVGFSRIPNDNPVALDFATQLSASYRPYLTLQHPPGLERDSASGRPAPPRIVPSRTGRWGWVDDVSTSKKFSLQHLPPAPARIVPSARGRWGWPKDLDLNGSQHQPKKYRCRTYPPGPARIVPSAQGRWGGLTTSSPMDLDIAEKNFASATSTPPAGEESSRVEEDDWVVDDLTSIKKVFTLEHCLPSR